MLARYRTDRLNRRYAFPAVTSRRRFAKQAATVDHLSDGRLVLGMASQVHLPAEAPA